MRPALRKPQGTGIASLTPRELQTARMFQRGMITREICVELNLSYGAVSCYRTRILEKLNLGHPRQLAGIDLGAAP
jgi:DNA-binding CsgD family transcriptional regulator